MKIEQMQFKNPIKFVQKVTNRSLDPTFTFYE